MKFKSVALILSLLIALTLSSPVARAQSFHNPSFEPDHYINGVGYAFQNTDVIQGWIISDDQHIGLNIGGSNNPTLFANNGAIPDGTNVAFIQCNNAVTNSLSTTISSLVPGMAYQVTFRANCRQGYAPPMASWSLNGGPPVPFTCAPAVGGSNPYYTNSATFTATKTNAVLVVQNWVTNGSDGTVLIDDFTVEAVPQTLVHYRVNATDAGNVVNNDTVPNQGSLGDGIDGGVGVGLTNDIPTNGVPPGYGNNSIVCNGSGGILSPGTQQLTRTNIAAAGGFTYEAWFKWNGGGNVNAIIDYAGTEKLIRQTTQSGPAMETDNSTVNQIGVAASNQWHYAAVVFTVTSSAISSDSVTGNYTFYLDTNTPVATVSGITITSFGDTLNRTIGVGTHPAGFSTDYFNGLIYEPRVTLGALPAGGLLFKSTVMVTNPIESGPGALRNVVASDTSGAAMIQFAPPLAGQTILLTNGDFTVTNNLIIDGSTAGGLAISGGKNTVLFNINTNGNLTLNSLTLCNGNGNGNNGGAINNSGHALLIGCTLTANATGSGGAIMNNPLASLTLDNCLVTSNVLTSSFGGGGAILNQSQLGIYNCTFIANVGGYSAGAIDNDTTGTLVISNSTFFNNTAIVQGGVIDNNNLMTAWQSTFTSNTCFQLGGVLTVEPGASSTLIGCTLANNQAGDAVFSYSGGGAINHEGNFLVLSNCLIAGNVSITPNGPDLLISASGLTADHCLIGNGTSSTLVNGVNGNLVGTSASPINALLAPLGFYGGPTPTMPPLGGSPAIGTGNNAITNFFSSDQRGFPRQSGAQVDIGAVEVNTNCIVTITADNGGGSLRNAVANAAANDLVSFVPALSGQSIGLTSGQINVSRSVTIDGSALASPVQINGNNTFRIFSILSGDTTLNSLIITNGNASSFVEGGGILQTAFPFTLTLTNCSVVGNSAGEGGGIFAQIVVLNQCTIADNNSSDTGGGVFGNVNLTVNESTFYGNTAVAGGGVNIFGLATVNESTFFGNVANPGSGGAIAEQADSLLLINQDTFTGNTAPAGGGIINFSSTVIVTNSIVSLNNGGNLSSLGGTVVTNSSNLIDRTDIELASLGNYGGPTLTMPPLAGSPAIDAGNGAVTNFLATDQRGRPRLEGSQVDIGAVEVNPNTIVTTNSNAGTGSLRKVVATVLPNDLVSFAPNLSGQVIVLTNGQIVLSNNITIDASALASPMQINGNQASRIFGINSNASVTLNSLVLTNGYASGNSGGAVSGSATSATTMKNCVVVNSTADVNGGGILNDGALSLLNTSVANNSASQAGGGINNDGALSVGQCTIAGNFAMLGGGISSGGTIVLLQSTVVSNADSSSSYPGGIHNGAGTAALIVSNSIIAGNKSPNVTLLNFDNGLTGIGNITNGNPQLAALGYHGGSTPTMPPLPGSPAIDAGSNAVAAGFTTDQRGYPRIAGARVDIGAVEGVYIVAGPGKMTNITRLGDGSIQIAFTNYTDANVPVLATINVIQSMSNWTQIGFAIESPAGSGHYQFTDPQISASIPQRFYRLRSP